MSLRVTVVVLNWCDEGRTARCLRSLQDADHDALTLLLVDNGSPDGSGDRLRAAFPEVEYLQTGSNLGYAGGNNRGIERALSQGADAVLILNNDTVVEPDAVPRLVRTLESEGEGVGGVAPKILRLDDPSVVWYAGGEFSRLHGVGLHPGEGRRDPAASADEGPRDVTFLSGCCCLLSASALRASGGFDESFFAYVEDAELSLRLTSSGYRLLYEPRARILHDVPPAGTQPSPFQIRRRDLNRRRLMRMHFGWHERAPFLARFYLTRALLLVRYLVTGDLGRARAIAAGAFGPLDPRGPTDA